MKLIEWLDSYINYLYSFKGNLVMKKTRQNKVICEYKDKGTVTYFVKENLDLNIDLKQDHLIIICLNSKNNLNFLTENWTKFITNNTLKVMFVNSTLNLQWTVIPYLHNRFTDPVSLKQGLKSLSESIPEVKV